MIVCNVLVVRMVEVKVEVKSEGETTTQTERGNEKVEKRNGVGNV